jgi:hypothetical protein
MCAVSCMEALRERARSSDRVVKSSDISQSPYPSVVPCKAPSNAGPCATYDMSGTLGYVDKLPAYVCTSVREESRR